MDIDNKTYSTEKKDGKLYISHAFSEEMNIFYKHIEAPWKSPYRIVDIKFYDIVLNQLKYCYGEENDKPVDLIIEVDSLDIRDKLVIFGHPIIKVDILGKNFSLSKNLYIPNKYDYESWQKVSSISRDTMNYYFFTRLFIGLLRPFKLTNCSLHICSISETRAKLFISTKPKWAKKISIVESKHDKFFDFSSKPSPYSY